MFIALLKIVGLQYGTCFILSFWRLEFGGTVLTTLPKILGIRAAGAHREFFTWGGGADCEDIYNSCLILKTLV